MDNREQFIAAFLEKTGQVKLGRIVRAFRVSDKTSVEIQVQTAGHAQERNGVVLCQVMDFQLFAVDADKIVLVVRLSELEADLLVHTEPGEHTADRLCGGDDGRLIGELIADIDIEGPVNAVKLPAAGHGHFVKGDAVRIQLFRELGGHRIEFKIPVPVEADDLFGAVPLFEGRDGVGLGTRGIGNKISASGKLVRFKEIERIVVRGI